MPLLVVGRAVQGGALLLGVIGFIAAAHGSDAWRDMRASAISPLGLMAFAVLALWLPSMAASPMPGRSFEAWARVPVFLACVGLIWATLAREAAALDLALKTLIAASAVAVVPATLAFVGLTEVISLIRARGWVPNDPILAVKGFGAVALLMLPVVVWAGTRLGRRWRAVALTAGAGLLGIIWLTHNRSALAGLLAMILVGGLLAALVWRRPAVVTGVGVGLSLLVAGLMVWLRGYRDYLLTPDGVVTVLPNWLIGYQRQTIWHFAYELGWQAPWFGRGINVINFLPGAEQPMADGKLTMIPGHPHNWLLEVFVETGVVGVAALAALVVAIAVTLGRDYLRGRDPALLAALMVHVGYWASGLFNFSFWSAWWQVSYLVLMALSLAGRRTG